jgi:hypothetical protein
MRWSGGDVWNLHYQEVMSWYSFFCICASGGFYLFSLLFHISLHLFHISLHIPEVVSIRCGFSKTLKNLENLKYHGFSKIDSIKTYDFSTLYKDNFSQKNKI